MVVGRQGFTLIELIVVVAVIALLAVFGLVAFQNAIKQSHVAKDVGNLRSIGASLLAFAGENQGRFPEAGRRIQFGEIGEKGLPAWTGQLNPYVQEGPSVFLSPRFAGSRDEAGYFLCAHAAIASEGEFGPVYLQRMKAPSQTILAGVVGAADLFEAGDWDKDDYTQSPAFDNTKTSRLKPAISILFADRHVRSCAYFDTNTMTAQYEQGFWYSF